MAAVVAMLAAEQRPARTVLELGLLAAEQRPARTVLELGSVRTWLLYCKVAVRSQGNSATPRPRATIQAASSLLRSPG